MISDTLFEGDLPKSKKSESNILSTSEGLVIESLTMIREEARLEECDNLLNDDIREIQPVFYKNSNFGKYPSFDSSDTEGDNRPIMWLVQKRDENVSKNVKEKVVEGDSIRKPFTRSDAKKMLVDAMKDSAKSTARNKSARNFIMSKFQMLSSVVVEVSGGESDVGFGKKNLGKMKQSV